MAYDAGANAVFFKRLWKWSINMEDILKEGQSLDDLWIGQDIPNDSDFIQVDHMTTDDATNTITLLRAIKDFMRNGAVTQGDRIPTLTAMLGREIQ